VRRLSLVRLFLTVRMKPNIPTFSVLKVKRSMQSMVNMDQAYLLKAREEERDIESGDEITESCRWHLPAIGFLAALLMVILFVSLHFGGLL